MDKKEILNAVAKRHKMKNWEQVCTVSKLNEMIEEAMQLYHDTKVKNLAQPDVSGSLPLKVCTGCGHRSDRHLKSKTALACCPDNNYVDLDDYLKDSVYKRQ